LKYQILIVGAGIAGLTAGLESSRLGYNVAIFEKEKKIGSPLSCAEYIPTPVELEKMFPKVDNFKDLLAYPKKFTRNKCKKTRVYGSSNRFWEFNLNAHVVDRSRLQQYLADQCESEGVTIHKGVTVTSFKPNGDLTFNDKNFPKISGEICIAADGPTSRIAQNAGLSIPHFPHQLSPCQGYIMENVNLDSDICHVFMSSKYAPGGYGWIIPRGKNQANIGIGVRKSFMQNDQKLSICLKRFIEHNPVVVKKIKQSKISEKIRGLVPIAGPIPLTYTPNLMVVGDAAGFVMACNGGGIPTAVLSGYLAANTAHKHLTEGKPISIYEEEWKKQMGNVLRDTVKIRKMMDIIMTNDSMMENLMNFVGSRRVGEMTTCHIPFLIKIGYPLVRMFLKLFPEKIERTRI
jgi:digeranylgeranylglycerophospholipid reductase